MMTFRKLRAVKTIQRHGRAYIHMDRVMKDIDISLKSAKENKEQGLSDDLIGDISQQPRYMYFDKELQKGYRFIANEVWSEDIKRSRDESSLKFSKITNRWLPPTQVSHYYIEKDMENKSHEVKETELRDGTFTINSEFSNFVMETFPIWKNNGSIEQFIRDYGGGKFFSDLGPLFEEAITDLDNKGKHMIIQKKTPITLKNKHKDFLIEIYHKYLKFQISQIA